MNIPEYEARFAAIAGVLTAFASRHNLLIDKYYHDIPVWMLRCRHPKGGEARLDVECSDEFEILIGGVWCVDDYDSFTRRLRWLESRSVESADLDAELENGLKTILGWAPGESNQVARGYQGMWDKFWTKKEFEAMKARWPEPH